MEYLIKNTYFISILFFSFGLVVISIFILIADFKQEKYKKQLKEKIRQELRNFYLDKNNKFKMPPNAVIFGNNNLTFQVLQESEFKRILKYKLRG